MVANVKEINNKNLVTVGMNDYIFTLYHELKEMNLK